MRESAVPLQSDVEYNCIYQSQSDPEIEGLYDVEYNNPNKSQSDTVN